MTDKDTLMNLIDEYAEARHINGCWVYNSKTAAARQAVIEALGEVQALSAAPEAFLKSVIALCSHRGYSPANIEAWDKDDKWIADLWRQAESMLAASPTPPAEQQAAPKAAPGEQDDHQILAITTAYEQGVGKGHQAYNSGKEIANPYSPAYRCDLAWQYGYKEGKEQAQREAKAAPAPLSEMPYEKRKAIQEGEQIGASDAWFHARHNMLDTLDRRNVFRAGFDRGWNAALAAQGGE